MTLVLTASFDDEDPDLHTHFTAYAHALDERQPVEFARVLRTLEESLEAYRTRVNQARMKLELRLTTEEERREATRGQ
jgi:hypothetical protein